MSIKKLHLSIFIVCLSLTGFAQDKDATGYLLHSIYFGGGSYFVDEAQQKELLDFIGSVKNLDHYEISIHAHTDNIGSKAYNDWLSAQRSEAVVQLLERYSVDRRSVAIKSFGKLNAVYDNSSWMGRIQNRRVDVILWPISL